MKLREARGLFNELRLPDSFLWICKDDEGWKTQLAILFERQASGQFIVVVHAYRDVRE